MPTARSKRSEKKHGKAGVRPATVETRGALKTIVALALLLSATALAYSPVLSAKFIDFDDREGVEINPDFNPPHLAALGHYWVEPFRSLYIPLAYTVWGGVAVFAYGGEAHPVLNPAVFHAANLLIHLASSGFVFLIMLRLTRSLVASWLAAALFALHPVQVEAVAYVTGLYTLLSGVFSFVALWFYQHYSEARDEAAPAKPSRVWVYFGLATLCFGLGLLSKPSTIVLPAVAILLDWMQRRPLHPRLLPLSLWCVMAVPLALVTRSIQASPSTYSAPLLWRPFVSLDALAFYLGKLVLPIRLIPDYGRTPHWLMARPGLLVLGVVPLLALGLAWLGHRKSRWPMAVAGMFVVALFPVLGLIPFAFQRYSTVADRYLYLAMLAPSILCAYALLPASRRLVRAVALVGICVLGVLTFIQSQRWHDSRSLFEYTTQINPRSFAANFVLGFVDARDGFAAEARAQNDIEHQVAHAMVVDALRHDLAALEIAPNDPQVLANLGNLYLKTGRLEEAVKAYRQSAAIAPAPAMLWNNLGIALLQLKQVSEAQSAFVRAIELEPRNADAYANWGILLMRSGDKAGAAEKFNRALEIDPNSRVAQRNLGLLNNR